MHQKYTDLSDLWCGWGDATTAIMNHIKDNEPLDSDQCWRFEEGRTMEQHGGGYSVYIAHRAYDPTVQSFVRLHVQAFVSANDEITVKTNKREKIELE
jgi:hypothetical protein